MDNEAFPVLNRKALFSDEELAAQLVLNEEEEEALLISAVVSTAPSPGSSVASRNGEYTPDTPLRQPSPLSRISLAPSFAPRSAAPPASTDQSLNSVVD